MNVLINSAIFGAATETVITAWGATIGALSAIGSNMTAASVASAALTGATYGAVGGFIVLSGGAVILIAVAVATDALKSNFTLQHTTTVQRDSAPTERTPLVPGGAQPSAH